MYKKIKLSVPGFLAAGLFMTGCSQQSIQPAATLAPTAIDAQVQEVITPTDPPKVYSKPKMVKPVQRMAKPVQRQHMAKPVQRHKMMNSMKHRMVKPTQRQSTY